MSAEIQVLQLRLNAFLADIPADVLKAAVEVCKAVGADTEIAPNIPSIEMMCAAAGILSERMKPTDG